MVIINNFWLDWYPTLWLLNVGGPLELYFSFQSVNYLLLRGQKLITNLWEAAYLLSGLWKGWHCFKWGMGQNLEGIIVLIMQVPSLSAIKCQGNFRIFQFVSGIPQQKICQRLSRNLYIFALVMALAHFGILPKSLLWFF